MRRPFRRGGAKRTTLGLKVAPAAIGWALLAQTRGVGEERVVDDSAETALQLARAKGVQEVELYRYLNVRRFEDSPASEDLTLFEHGELIKRTAELLTANGFTVFFKDVT